MIQQERRRWAPLKRALPKEDQAIFDRLFDCAKLHVQAGVMVSRPWPFETIVMAVLLEQEKRVEQVLKRLEALQRSGTTPSEALALRMVDTYDQEKPTTTNYPR